MVTAWAIIHQKELLKNWNSLLKGSEAKKSTPYGKIMLIRVKKVEYLCEYKLRILFSNGRTKIVDFENWISEGKGYLKPLKDVEFFKKVQLDDCNYSICWPNEADFCPDVLYAMGKEVPKKRVIKHHKKTPRHLAKPRTSRKKKIHAST